ncbi:MAG: TRAP transporter permease [Candidatus Micropelagos thuwalensis]
MASQRKNSSKSDLNQTPKTSDSLEWQAHPASWVSLICVLWSLFQLWIAADFPFYLSEITGLKLVFNGQEARQIHLAFGIGLALAGYQSARQEYRKFERLVFIGLAILGVSACLYLFAFKVDIANRAGLPNSSDLFFSIAGIICVMLAVYRAIGLPLLVVSSLFLFYVMFGHLEIFPDVMRWKGASLNKATWHFWMQTEGVFGVALGVSASMIFLFVLFGALLERAGAGNYFIKLSFSALGHLRGGPAKAAVVASGLSGIYSGSSIANVVTTGTFTIPLMKKTGLSAEKSGAIEVAASTNGQLTPPVMGAAAFLIAEFTGVSYFDLIKHAALPAIVSYIALFYLVHLEVSKLKLEGLKRITPASSLLRKITGFILGFSAAGFFAVLAKLGIDGLQLHAPSLTSPAVILVLLGLYVFLLRIAARHPDLTVGLNAEEIKSLPSVTSVAITGYYFVLPIVILLWCVLVNRLSPGLSAYWACMAMLFILVTQHPLKAFFRDQPINRAVWVKGFKDLRYGLENGARNMISIAVATGIAGIIIGTVSLTGAHQFIGEFVEVASGGSLVIMLLLVAVMCLILGMGLPTTANYIVVSSLMAPVIVMVGAQNGLIVPLVAVHLFVFYFGILADDTPPVGLAAYAAAAISKGDPIRTGIQGFSYDIRTAVLPFMFIFNTGILLIDVSFVEGIVIFITATIGMMAFCSATQQFIFVKTRLWETLALLLVAFTLFRPDFWLNQISPPYLKIDGHQVETLLDGGIADAPSDLTTLRIRLSGPDFDDAEKIIEKNTILTMPIEGNAFDRLNASGLFIQSDGDIVQVEEPFPGTPLFQELSDFDFYADRPVQFDAVFIEIKDRPAKELFYMPALLLLGLIIWCQRQRYLETKRLVG